MSLRRPFLMSTLAIVSMTACSDPLALEQLIEEPRVLGARAYLVDDPTQSTPQPGERLQIEWLVVGPSGVLEVTALERACWSAPTARGIPECEGEPFSSDRRETSAPLPTFFVDVPEPDSNADVLLLEAAFCPSGSPEIAEWPDQIDCGSQDSALGAMLALPTDEDPPNLRPDLSQASLSFDDLPWNPLNTENPCDPDSIDPQVNLDTTNHRIELQLPADARESVDGRIETLEITQTATLGELERPRSFIEADDTELKDALTWTPPKIGLEGPTTVHFFFVVHDQRGGVDWMQRSLCVRP